MLHKYMSICKHDKQHIHQIFCILCLYFVYFVVVLVKFVQQQRATKDTSASIEHKKRVVKGVFGAHTYTRIYVCVCVYICVGIPIQIK